MFEGRTMRMFTVCCAKIQGKLWPGLKIYPLSHRDFDIMPSILVVV